MRVGMRELYNGDHVPRFYGITYYRADREEIVLYPIPFNLIIGIARNLVHHMRAGVNPSVIDRAFEAGSRVKTLTAARTESDIQKILREMAVKVVVETMNEFRDSLK